jgi:hybrid cluster-associated redox disulfide protein
MQMPDINLSTMTVAQLLRRWPETVRVFLDYKMNCPACPIAPFMTIDEAAGEYGVDADALTHDLMRAAQSTGG